jgi:hypothetical protein
MGVNADAAAKPSSDVRVENRHWRRQMRVAIGGRRWPMLAIVASSEKHRNKRSRAYACYRRLRIYRRDDEFHLS